MAYTVLDISTGVKDDLKDTSFNSTRLLRYLNEAQRVIFNTHLFRFCEKTATSTLAIGDSSFTLPADHQATVGGSLIDTTTNQAAIILNGDSYLSHRTFFERFPSPSTSPTASTQSVPSYWTQFGGIHYFDCRIDKAYQLTHRYYRVPTELTGDAGVPEVPEVFRDVLESFMKYKAEKYRGNHDIAATWRQDFEDSLEAMNMRYSDTEVDFPVAQQYRDVVYDQ